MKRFNKTELEILSRVRQDGKVSGNTSRTKKGNYNRWFQALRGLAKDNILRAIEQHELVLKSGHEYVYAETYDLAVECYNGNHNRDIYGNCLDCDNDDLFIHPGCLLCKKSVDLGLCGCAGIILERSSL